MEEKIRNKMIIAEAGINHGGSLEKAKRLVDVAKYVGADAVKFQTFWGIPHLSTYELEDPEWYELIEYCRKRKIKFMSTPHVYEAIGFLNPHVDVFKIASPFLNNKGFLEEIVKYKKPVFLSTGNPKRKDGMATLKQIKTALDILKRVDVTLMHCVSKYPCYNGHFERIKLLEDRFRLPVGLSDHTKSIMISYDVPIIEKHIMTAESTYEGNCIDYNVSLYPWEFKKMVENING